LFGLDLSKEVYYRSNILKLLILHKQKTLDKVLLLMQLINKQDNYKKDKYKEYLIKDI